MSSDDDGCQWDQSLEQEVRLEAGAFCLRRITQTQSLSLPEALQVGKQRQIRKQRHDMSEKQVLMRGRHQRRDMSGTTSCVCGVTIT
jgi:hypothetical protein